MQVTELSAEGLKRQFKIVVPAGDLSAKVDERLAELAKTAQMPGFRQGKVPVGLLKKQYGQALFGEALEQAVNSSTAKAIEDRGLKPALQPRVDLKTARRGQGRRVRGRDRGAARDRQARLLRGRARAPEGRRARQGRRGGDRPHRQGQPRAEAGRPAAPGAEGRRHQDRLRGLGRRHGIPRRRRAGLHARAGLGLVHSRLRGPARRRRGRQGRRREGDLPGRLRRARARRQGRRLQVHDQGDPRVRRQAGRR